LAKGTCDYLLGTLTAKFCSLEIFKVLPLHKEVCWFSLKNSLAVEQRKPTIIASKTQLNSLKGISLQLKYKAILFYLNLFCEAGNGMKLSH